MKCHCRCSRVVCFLFHGEPTWAWWVVYFGAQAAFVGMMMLATRSNP